MKRAWLVAVSIFASLTCTASAQANDEVDALRKALAEEKRAADSLSHAHLQLARRAEATSRDALIEVAALTVALERSQAWNHDLEARIDKAFAAGDDESAKAALLPMLPKTVSSFLPGPTANEQWVVARVRAALSRSVTLTVGTWDGKGIARWLSAALGAEVTFPAELGSEVVSSVVLVDVPLETVFRFCLDSLGVQAEWTDGTFILSRKL